jgi:dolichyl-phosphate-mannose--protein O-mannosyl transferase
VLDWLVDRLSTRPSRRDRSSELESEPPGCLDRLDLLVVVVLVVASLALRGFRLEEPYGMYFDEVYHARTATEFLQDWEYGQPHAIYEYTHPHLAKYAMALGIQVAGGNHVTASSHLQVPVRGAVLEPRWSPGHDPGLRNGDRLYVGTGSELRVYDLAGRDLEQAFAFPATALALDQVRHVLYIADLAGAIYSLDTTRLDARRHGLAEPGGLEAVSAGPGRAVDRLAVTDASLLAVAPGGTLSAFDPQSGKRLGERFVSGISGVVALPPAERLVVDPGQVRAPARLAAELATELDDDADRIEGLLASGAGSVVVAAYLEDAARDRIASRIDAGGLAGVGLEQGPLLAVGAVDGIRILDARSLDQVDLVPTEDPVSGLVLVERGLSEPTLYLAAGTRLTHIPVREEGLGSPSSLVMPGPVRQPAWNEPANLVHVLGDRPGGGSTLYVVEPHGDSVFADAPLPTEPAFLLVDTQPERPALDRGQLLAVGSDGSVSAVGILGNAFGWRLPGVLMAALGAALVYLLARLLFARRSVGLAASVLVLAEGMLYANARIAMNDVYVTTFILAATLLFAAVYRGVISGAALGLTALLGAGVALGLALASKWVAAYAIGGLVLLVLFRSGLGRLVALAGMVVLTAVLGALAIRAPPELVAEGDPNRNWTFLLIMILLTALLAAAIVRRPLPVRRSEVWLAFAGCLVIGLAALVAGTVVERGTLPEGLVTPFRLRVGGVLAILAGLGAVMAAWLAARAGRGPFARCAGQEEDGTPPWFAPARLGGLAWLLTLATLTIVPVLIYVLSYAPWVALGNQWGLPGFPEGGTGQTLGDLTVSMYQYHDSLRAQHAASSPWWAWPFDLKPVWFYQEAFAGSTTGLIYDSGNLVVFWLGVPAMAFAAWAAWRRRSLSLAVIVVMWLALWLPWSRIDRATFQYHVYASLPFLVIALAYFLAELWHGATRHAWALARVAAALAILGPPLLWLLRGPLCLAAGTESVNPGGQACGAPTRTVDVSHAALVAVLFLALGAVVATWLGWRTARARSPRASWSLLALLAVVLVTLGGVLVALTALSQGPAFSLVVAPESLAIVALVALAVPAAMALRARDARRFVVGVLGAAALWFLVWFPNLSGLPLPSDVASVYQGLLPTWNWDFQFAVNLDPPTGGGLIDTATLVVAAITLLAVLAAAAAACLRGRAGEQEAAGAPAGRPALPGAPRPGAPSTG